MYPGTTRTHSHTLGPIRYRCAMPHARCFFYTPQRVCNFGHTPSFWIFSELIPNFSVLAKQLLPSGGARGPPEAPCAAQQCGNGAPALLVSTSTDFPIKYG